ncbi:SAM-dependent methyltransferase [Spirosoma utsteinense]|uniref:16S rRNA (Cytidine1402-2'-O)-methyltransferase n=1 Tax=Spirosoma utsteinense TaxID=2585773 RepID=A0ABR6W9X0_9BACT|nr:SAM-dependent methyltransferase [Spirosoma utsteinense]MBC3786056.1 16S rRNA (cytidine1402-2'-O)-methyltransferase [Spirosoma utsteinense]MBC3793357.1 16S rRNA (cytidine1402-2'-O)-methyltransferase [Spirosoma utsteinense]
MPTLYLIPTLLADDTAAQVLPPHIREVLEKTDAYFVENVRSARRFISGLKTTRVIDETTFFELDKDTLPADTRRQIQELMERKRNAGVLSEAGCPGVADPGAVIVSMAHTLGWRVEPLVGPSSILLALMASGLNGQSFVFHGYLPIEKADRAKAIRFLEKEAQQRIQTQIFIETPYRNDAMFADIIANCEPNTRLCVASNLTAPDAFVRTLSIREWKSQVPELRKKPTVFLLL